MARAHTSGVRSRPTVGASPLERVRWDRLGRIAMLCVLIALLYLYISAGVRLFSTWSEARGDSAQVSALEHEHTALEHQRETLGRRGDVEAQARKLGMMSPNEQPYVITGLPNN